MQQYPSNDPQLYPNPSNNDGKAIASLILDLFYQDQFLLCN